MTEFFLANWSNILLGLISAGLLAFCRWTWKQMKTYRKLLEEKEHAEIDDRIDEKIAPVVQEIEALREYVRGVDLEEKRKLDLIIASYRYRLVQLCKLYLK